MKLLDKDERFTLYILLLAEAEENWESLSYAHDGLCHLCSKICGYYPLESQADMDAFGVSPQDVLFSDLLPELINKKPHGYSNYWFGHDEIGWQKRMELLRQCIKETHP